jgi:hypothetical protein
MWQALQTMRHHPPGQAPRGNRRDTFNGAIEQAEQIFHLPPKPPVQPRDQDQNGAALAAADPHGRPSMSG